MGRKRLGIIEYEVDDAKMSKHNKTIEKARCALPFASGFFGYGRRFSPTTKLI